MYSLGENTGGNIKETVISGSYMMYSNVIINTTVY